MSFFITSAGPGDGANLGGLDGADAHCAMLAGAAGSSGKTWRAYLSADGVNARDRIGSGPWYNAAGVQVALNVEELHYSNVGLIKATQLNENGEVVNGSLRSCAEHGLPHEPLTRAEVTRRFPGSVYARDARLKIDLARDHLAGKEMTVGRYYLRRGNPVAAIGRFRMVIERYQTTSHAPEALHRLTEAYLALGVPNEAQTSAAVLGHNYPGSRWYQHSYALLLDSDLEPEADEGSWISRVFGDVF